VAKASTGVVPIADGKEAAPVPTLHKCMVCRPAFCAGRRDYSKRCSGPADLTTDKE